MSSSHLFDFIHGWLYVLGVGIVGGMILGKAHFPSGGKDGVDSLKALDPSRPIREADSAPHK